ncbi:MAG: MFS transporter [Phycisphaerales bacterium]|nr:MFS transporter [Phycisphaerales bacterium]
MRFRGITRNVVILGLVSLFTDLATEMLYPIIPLFVVGTLGASPALLGLIEGLAEGISSGLRWVGGRWSDRLGRRKPFVIAGYSLSALSKPAMGLAASVLGWPLFLFGRCSDRFGKSIRTAARDALIADSTDPAYRGIAFGFHRAADTTGAVAGPLVSLAILGLWPHTPLATLFLIALAPGLVSVVIATLGVREIRQKVATPKRVTATGRFPRSFWIVLIAFGIFSLGNSSDSFLLLRSSELGLSFTQVVCAYALYNAVYAVAALPLGALSDRIGRRPVVIAGWLCYAGVYAAFAYAQAPIAAWILLPIYGLYQALTEGVLKALVTDIVPSEQRGSALGLVATVGGFGQLAASLLAGALWQIRIIDGMLATPFVIGAACALVAAPFVLGARQVSREGVKK